MTIAIIITASIAVIAGIILIGGMFADGIKIVREAEE